MVRSNFAQSFLKSDYQTIFWVTQALGLHDKVPLYSDVHKQERDAKSNHTLYMEKRRRIIRAITVKNRTVW